MRKSSFRLILAALAATAALTACTKEPTPAQTDQTPASPAAEGSRVIAVSFGPQTKTRLDGLQPKFNDGDSILLVKSGTETDTCRVSVDDEGIATISTNLTGALEAFYPKDGVTLNSKGAFFPVPQTQSGKFSDANICKATIAEGSDNAEFGNQYALFIITPPANTKSLIVRSLRIITEAGQRGGDPRPIWYGSNPNTAFITIPNLHDEDTCYVALGPTAYLSDLSFEAWFDEDGTTGSIKGIPTSVIEIQAENLNLKYEGYNTIVSGTAYTIDSNNWHEYVTVANRKWATTNIGAVSETDAGEYFAWGGTTGYVSTLPNGDWYSFSPPDSTLLEGGFCWATCPHTQDVYTDSLKSVFTKYTADNSEFANSGIADDKTILDLEDDAAYVKWGGAWRMPTLTELDAMILKPKGPFNSGQHFGDNDNPSLQIFLPAAGSGDNNYLNNIGDLRYWSSSLYDSSPNSAWSLFFNASQDKPSCGEAPYRYYGYTIRAIVDEPADGNQEDALQD